MTMSRTVRSLLTLSATAALVITAPGLTGVASAHDNGSGSRQHSSASLQGLTEVQVAAVKAARTAYFQAVGQAKDTLKTTLKGFRTTIEASLAPLRDAVKLAHDAYEAAEDSDADAATLAAAKTRLDEAVLAYRTAWQTAVTAYKPQIEAAQATAKAAIEKARTDYVAAITAAFPGQTVPRGLLNPPGHGLGNGRHNGWLNGMGHGFGTRLGSGMGMGMSMGDGNSER